MGINAFRIIAGMADRINLTKTIVDRANVLFKMVSDGKHLKGRSNDAIAAACLYIACRQEGVPRTFKEIVAVSTVSKKEIGRCFKLILKAHDTSVDLITTGDFMSRFCVTLTLSREVQKAATCIAKKAVDLDIVPGRSPISVAAAAIYMASQASDDKRAQREIAEIAGVADVTIRQSYKLMLPRAAELFPEISSSPPPSRICHKIKDYGGFQFVFNESPVYDDVSKVFEWQCALFYMSHPSPSQSINNIYS